MPAGHGDVARPRDGSDDSLGQDERPKLRNTAATECWKFPFFGGLASGAALISLSTKPVIMRVAVAMAKLAQSDCGTPRSLSGRKNQTARNRFAILHLGPTAGMAQIDGIVDAEPSSGSEGVAEGEDGRRGRRLCASPDGRVDPPAGTSRQAAERSFGNCELRGVHALASVIDRALVRLQMPAHGILHIANG